MSSPSGDPIIITGIGDFVRQGLTEPIYCTTAAGHEYVVKGNRAGFQALIAEWVANRLGKLLHLPIPDFAILQVNPQFFRYGALDEKLSHLGKRPVFGSKRELNVVELRQTDIASIDLSLQARVLAFDLWIANSDRVFIEGRGNPNLLWNEEQKALVVIDHNRAFQPGEMDGFFQEHAFRAAARTWTESFKSAMMEEFRRALIPLESIWDELPEEWTDVDGETSLGAVSQLLWKFEREPTKFWDAL